MLILLLIGLILSFIEVWKGANKNSQKTKILNIVDEDAPKKVENKRAVQHLFEDEDLEGQFNRDLFQRGAEKASLLVFDP